MADPATPVGMAPAPEQAVVGFVRALRAEGIAAPVGSTLAFAEALAALDVNRRDDLYWSGGTRIGEGLREFNDRWGVRGMARGAVVVILSDGWDRGEPEVLAEQMARLKRVAFRVVWVNPLKATPEYAPLARGMAAALPFVDEFVEGHSLAALEDLVEVIAK